MHDFKNKRQRCPPGHAADPSTRPTADCHYAVPNSRRLSPRPRSRSMPRTQAWSRTFASSTGHCRSGSTARPRLQAASRCTNPGVKITITCCVPGGHPGPTDHPGFPTQAIGAPGSPIGAAASECPSGGSVGPGGPPGTHQVIIIFLPNPGQGWSASGARRCDCAPWRWRTIPNRGNATSRQGGNGRALRSRGPKAHPLVAGAVAVAVAVPSALKSRGPQAHPLVAVAVHPLVAVAVAVAVPSAPAWSPG